MIVKIEINYGILFHYLYSSRKYATYIPTCIFFDRECNILTRDGVAAIASDPNAEAFPYKGYKAPASLLQNPTFIIIVVILIVWLVKRFG